MEIIQESQAIVFVDPQCPFAWITAGWLLEVSRRSPLRLRIELMSLACVNENRELDDWYRDYNDQAWRPARVAAALLASPAANMWQRFYSTFGKRRHVDGMRENATNLATTLAELELPAVLAEAAEDPTWDDDLRARTRAAVEPSGGEGGTPMVHTGGRAFFGPVLTAIPRGRDAIRMWDAVSTLAGTAAFAEIRGARADGLNTV
ncbi:mycothiol-dependent nitroreductase Rv2466c family protein [Spelaeicoccus albus]|nr:disulfide bond formation protein DsbA [Spelaeicoccus albus]